MDDQKSLFALSVLEDFSHSFGKLSALLKPFLKLGVIDHEASRLGVRIVGSDFCKVRSVSFLSFIQYDDSICWISSFSELHESDCGCHTIFLCVTEQVIRYYNYFYPKIPMHFLRPALLLLFSSCPFLFPIPYSCRKPR